MIYLTNGNMPLNAAYADEIVQEDNNTYQLSFRFPTSDSLWEKLKEETFLTADDLHGEQEFVIFEVEKKHGYIQVYANQVFTLLNNYVVNPISLDKQTGSTALSRFAGSITRDNPFSFFSDIEDRHTFNVGSKNAMEAFAKDKHSIIGQWGGDLVRHGYQVRLLKNGGSENESLFMYKKNLSSYQHKTSTKSLKTRIIFTTTVKGEGEKAPDRTFTVTIDSPLINKYSQIYEDVIEVNDQDVKDEASLRKYGEQYYRTSLCDMMEDSLEIEVVGQSDVPVQMFDVVSIFHEHYNLDVRKKITKYIYSPMAKKLKSIGFGQFQSGLANAIGNAVSDAVKGEAQQLQDDFERQLARELKNADLAFDRQKEELVNQFTDGLNAAKARAEEVKRQLSDTIDQRFNSFDVSGIAEANRKAEEALEKSGANTSLIDEALSIGRKTRMRLDRLKRDFESAGEITDNLLGEIDRNLKKEINTTSEYRRTTDEMLSRMTGQMDGFATKSEVKQDISGLTETFAKLKIDTNNLISGTKSEITAAKTEFKKTAEGLSTKMLAVERYVSQDGQRQEALQRYARDESAKQVTAVRELVTRDYVGKTTYQEDVRGINQRIEEAKRNASNELTTRLANYRQTVDGKFTDISSQVTTYKQVADSQISNLSNRLTTEKQGTDGKIANLTNQVTNNKVSSDNQIANLSNQLAKKVEITDFQRVRETSQLYERILGTTEQGLPDKVSRLVMSSSIFQTEVGNFFVSDNNLIVNSETLDKYTLVGQRSGVSLGSQNGIFAINAVGLTSFNWSGFTLPIYVPKILKGEVYTISFKYKIKRKLDHEFRVNIKNHFKNKAVLQKVVANPSDPISSDWIEFQATSTMSEDFEFGSGKVYPLYFYLVKNGYVEIKEPILVRGSRSSSYKPSQFDDAYKATENAKQLAENAQAKAIQVAEQVNQAQQIAEATRTRVNQLAGSWAVQNLTSAGSIVSQINATNNQILIEAEKIRLKGKTLLDELTAIQGYFKRLFVGEGNFAKLNAEIIGANTITADKLIMDQAMARMFVSSDIFTDALAAKEAFITRLRSVVVSATLLEGFKGKIGGFQIGKHEKDPSVYWLTGQNQFAVGMSNGGGKWEQTALWVNWGWDWNKAGPGSWYVKHDGTMYCNSTAYFKHAEVTERLAVNGELVYYTNNGLGFYNYSPIYQKLDRSNNYLYLYYNKGNNYDWIPMNREISDRRYKSNIEDSTVSGLDVIENLKTYSYRKEYDGKIEDIACGIMAQDVQKYVPEAFYENPDGAYSYRTFELVPYLIKAIQELNQKIEKLEKTA